MNALTPAPTGAATEARPVRARREGRRTAGIVLGVLAFVAGWGASVALWGLPGLYLPALALVPLVWAVLIVISRG